MLQPKQGLFTDHLPDTQLNNDLLNELRPVERILGQCALYQITSTLVDNVQMIVSWSVGWLPGYRFAIRIVHPGLLAWVDVGLLDQGATLWQLYNLKGFETVLDLVGAVKGREARYVICDKLDQVVFGLAELLFH